jgi:hypothetical protein
LCSIRRGGLRNGDIPYQGKVAEGNESQNLKKVPGGRFFRGAETMVDCGSYEVRSEGHYAGIR